MRKASDEAAAIEGVLGALRAHAAASFGRIVDTFRKWDKDNSGFIDLSEFKLACHHLLDGPNGAGPDDGTLKAAFRSLDADRSGQLSYVELAAELRLGKASAERGGRKGMFATWAADEARSPKPMPISEARLTKSDSRLATHTARRILSLTQTSEASVASHATFDSEMASTAQPRPTHASATDPPSPRTHLRSTLIAAWPST